MRTRDKQIILRLTEKEYDELKANVAKTNLSMQAYLRTIIAGIQPKERVPMNLIETLQALQRVNTQLTIITLNARMMQEDGHLNCKAYWQSKGIGQGGKKVQPNPYKWKCSTISGILQRQEYCGDIINFKTTSRSFKNRRRIDNAPEDRVIFKDVHEPS